jgi:endo-1,4-beta-D-glucanase Y
MRIIELLCLAACCFGLSACQKQVEVSPNDASYFEETAKQQAKVVAISERWKKDRDIADFLLLKDSIQKGMKPEYVRQMLGDPVSKSSSDDGREFWLYVKIDPNRRPQHAWTLVFSPDKTVLEWKQKGMR